ncbi:MAG: KH domain-containing protein [Nanoarchaeota archaeon]|nr:KH domain-containing protein [Nanoarchaeota archaeon]
MTSYSYEIKIPKDRIAVLIGKSGEIKKRLEELSNSKLNIDSEEGDVTVTGDDAIKLFNIREVIKAIARGFNPETAQLLLKGDFTFEMINMNDFIRTKNDMTRLKGRVIGSEGKARRIIEELTETDISVYGKTIGIIGLSENVAVAKKAVENLLGGSVHSNVYHWLEKQRRHLKMQNVEKFLKGDELKEPEED